MKATFEKFIMVPLPKIWSIF